MAAITEEQKKRLREIRIALSLNQDLKALPRPIVVADLKMMMDRIDELDDETISCADEIISWARDRLDEDLRQKREWLQDAIENARIAELMVREAENALCAVEEIKRKTIYQHGDEINARWDAMAALYRAEDMLPVPEAVEQPDAEPDPEPPPPPEIEPQVTVPAPVSEFKPRPSPPAPLPPEEQERLMYEALKSAAGEEPEIQVSIAVLSEKSGVPNGSTLTVLRRLAEAGRIEIIPDKPTKGTPRPNIYRFTEPKALPPVEIESAVEKIADAWGAKVTPEPKRVKASGIVPQSIALRDRILGSLKKGACTTSGLASMLDVKELAVCQTLTAMEHEGTVKADEMPEGGRRVQLWRYAEPSPS